ncbi:CerR family C-terminal domain-containing protein [Rhodopseudomonas palustris]|uniref:CerR family C-terminal domain-containing protein n=1 Tax=Rhodopseudomonas palustris TaxID=1076 RepID=UPI0022F05F13|nr:CerR family C-terminal domain-containing protein [Rhodopseudomonas palustris]WBU28155.1 CerR family C-terminal domain-containing protein [Rhodopseudomonas palustris]
MKSNGHATKLRTTPSLGGQSHDTRARMIEAAIEVFGSVGYDGATTRQLAERAGVNQAAIPYHFGGKRELYVAAAQAIADYMRSRIEPLIDELRTASVDPVGHIDAVVMRFFQFIAGDEEPEAWTVFFVRCERDADDAFRIIYYQSVARFQAALIAEVAAATGRSPDDEDLKVRVAVVLGAISNFRTLRNVMLSSLGWDTFDAERKRTVETAVRRLALAELLGIHADAPSDVHPPLGSASGAQPSPTARP